MAENNPTPQPAAPAAKPRNPVEKLLVRGFICVMLLLVAVEGFSKWKHHSTMKALLAKIKIVDEVTDSPAMTEADVKQIVGGKAPSRSEKPENGNNPYGADRVDIYSWFTFSPVAKREIYVYYGKSGPQDKDGPDVLSVQLDDKPEQVQETPVAAASGPTQTSPTTGGGDGARGGRRGRGGPPGAHDPDAGKPDADKTDSEKADGDQPAKEKPDDAKPDDSDGDKESK